jgi:integrase
MVTGQGGGPFWQQSGNIGGGHVAITKRTDTSRKPWKVSWRERDGRQRSRSFGTKREAQAFHADITRSKALGLSTPLGPSKVRVADWLERWFTTYGREWAATTRRQRAYLCDKWVLPYIGDERLGHLSVAAIRDYRSRILDDGSTAKNANKVVRVLSSALTAAVDEELLPSNPCASLRSLPTHRTRTRALEPIQVERIRDVLDDERDRRVVSIMAYAGLRPAEVCGLTWAHVRHGVLIVEQSVQFGQIVSTKTNRWRTVEVSDMLADELEPYRGDDAAMVVLGDRGGLLDWHNWSSRQWRPVVRRLGIDCVPYDLRHTAASLWLHEGRSLAWVSKALGHSSQTTTLDHYSHVYDEAQLATGQPVSEAIRTARAALVAQ